MILKPYTNTNTNDLKPNTNINTNDLKVFTALLCPTYLVGCFRPKQESDCVELEATEETHTCSLENMVNHTT